MTWFKLSDDFYDHPKVMRAGNSAVGLWVRCCTYSANKEFDGRVPMETAHLLGARRDIDRLTAAGLWVIEEDVYWVPNFLKYNPSQAELEAKRVAALKRQASWRDRQRNNSVTDSEITP